MDVAADAFEREVIEASRAQPVVVDFWAPWCGPCRAVAPLLDELETELSGRLKIVKMNVDENQAVPGALQIRSIPTLVVFKDGQAVQGALGALPKAKLMELVTPHLAVQA